MDLPMMNQAQPQAQPQGQEQGKPFPATPAEAKKFSNDVLQVLYDERTHPRIVKQIEGLADLPQDVLGQGVGMIAAQLVGTRIADVRGQTGRPIEMRTALGALKAVIGEVSELAEDYGVAKVPPQAKAEAMDVGVEILDKTSQGGAENGLR